MILYYEINTLTCYQRDPMHYKQINHHPSKNEMSSKFQPGLKSFHILILAYS